MGVMTPGNSLTGVNRNGKEAARNIWTQEITTCRSLSRTRERVGQNIGRRCVLKYRSWQHAYRGLQEEPRKPTRKEARFATMVYNRIQWRTSRERTLAAIVEDRNEQVRYVSVAFLVVNLEKTVDEEESDATKKDGQENGTEETIIGGWIG